MTNNILLIFLGLIGVAMIVLTVFSEKENKNKCDENKRIKEYNYLVLSGGIITIVIVLSLFLFESTKKVPNRFAFG